MHQTLVPVLAIAVLLLGCRTDPQPLAAGDKAQARMLDAGAQAERDGAASAPQSEHDAGVKHDSDGEQEQGSGTVTAQCDAARCESQGDELAQSLRTPSSDVTTVKGGDCARVDIIDVVAGLACTCLSSNGWIYIGPDGAGCFARGRAGDCLWDDSEFKGCTRGDPTCPAKCEELGKRYAADAAKSFDVAVRFSTCRESSCRHVLRIGDACYTDRSIDSGRRFDCSLGDSEFLDREDAAN
jgi:hypothetical protein